MYDYSGTDYVSGGTNDFVNNYSHDLDGDLISSVDADGRTIAYAYDHLGEETGEIWYDASNNVTGTEVFTYDNLGETTSASNAIVTSSADHMIEG